MDFPHWVAEARLERPPGYEPGELPTAPLRDVEFRNADAKLVIFFEIPKYSANFYAV